jgi:hypothetical protein
VSAILPVTSQALGDYAEALRRDVGRETRLLIGGAGLPWSDAAALEQHSARHDVLFVDDWQALRLS